MSIAKEYQQWAAHECFHFIPEHDVWGNLLYNTLGLAGEAGEVVERVKKAYRVYKMQGYYEFHLNDQPELKTGIIEEAGDVLWYLANLFEQLGASFEDVMQDNMTKLKERYTK